MKMKVEWHQRNQVNVKSYIDRNRVVLQNLKEKLRKDEERYNFKEKQIAEALKQGKDGFDEDRFLIKRNVYWRECVKRSKNE